MRRLLKYTQGWLLEFTQACLALIGLILLEIFDIKLIIGFLIGFVVGRI